MIRLLIAAYLGGLLIFYTKAAFSIEPTNLWNNAYFWWDKSAGAGFFVWFVLASYCREYRPQLALIAYFSLIRFVWDVVSYFLNISVNNEWVVAALFLVLATLVGILCFWPESRFVRFLSKNVP